MSVSDRLPPLLTVEEAAKVLRIGRTKAYALAQEWRSSGGQSGLPVVDFGHVLRVPLCQLEQLVGGELTAPVDPTIPPTVMVESTPRVQPDETSRPSPTHPRATKRTRNRDKSNDAQLSLIDLTSND
jgi:hypothetical protein